MCAEMEVAGEFQEEEEGSCDWATEESPIAGREDCQEQAFEGRESSERVRDTDWSLSLVGLNLRLSGWMHTV